MQAVNGIKGCAVPTRRLDSRCPGSTPSRPAQPPAAPLTSLGGVPFPANLRLLPRPALAKSPLPPHPTPAARAAFHRVSGGLNTYGKS